MSIKDILEAIAESFDSVVEEITNQVAISASADSELEEALEALEELFK